MSTWELLDEKKGELRPWLRRAFWLPLRRMLQMFHILPVTAALILFVLLATDGQLREIYVSYLEDVGSGDFVTTAIRFATAAVGFALISAVLYEAHYLLSTVRFNVIYSVNAGVGTGSRLQHVREVAAIVLALSPWLGLVTGLLHTKIYLVNLFNTLQKANAPDIVSMQKVQMPSAWAIAATFIVLGLVMSFFVAANPKSRTLPRSIIVVTPPAAAFLFLLLTDPPLFSPKPIQIAGICASIAAVIAFYYFVYYRLQTIRAHFVYSHSLREDSGFNLRRRQRILLFIWALLPWVAVIGFYFKFAPPSAQSVSLHSWAMIPVAMSWVISTGLFVVFLLQRFRESPALKWSLYGAIVSLAVAGVFISSLASDTTIVTVYRLVGPLGSMALALLFLISIFVLLAVLSQRSGFPALTLVILALFGSVVLPNSVGWTVGSLAILCLLVLVMAVLSRLWAVAYVATILAVTGGINFEKMHGIKPVLLRPAPYGKELEQQFDSWIDNKKLGVQNSNSGGSADAAQSACSAKYVGTPQYPVFIIAVEGGGIYAASAASMFLARLQDRDPCFAEHVFAISAVSGGAIGATIFQALVESKFKEASATTALPATEPTIANNNGGAKSPPAAGSSNGCLPPLSKNDQLNTDHPLTDEVSAILQDDHFSPLVASIFPELLGFTRSGRAQELAASFEQSVNTEDRGAAEALCDAFAHHWSDSSKAPALVLNATWVETGFRAAFAPFPLHAIDDSLYSFADQNMPDDQGLTLIEAALVSARFPAVLPPYSVKIKKNKNNSAEKSTSQSTVQSIDNSTDTVRWNFVDGGYSDTSGAATALALYKALKDAAKTRNPDLRVILLTSSDPRLDANDINGTVFADTVAPIDAMLSVRDGLGNEAVARACDGIFGNQNSGANSGNTCEDYAEKPGALLQIVGIEDQTYGLSLGWKISQTTFSVVSWMLGDPKMVSADECNGQTSSDSNPTSQSNGQFTLNEKIVRRNSCVLRSILQSLGDAPAAQPR
ncbi:MAG: hypothetical protein ABSC37_00300 [Xanthobacteraceae bacterium]